MTALRELGERVTGPVLDAVMWERESRRQLLKPDRTVSGDVVTVWTHAPHVVGIITDAGERLTVAVGT